MKCITTLLALLTWGTLFAQSADAVNLLADPRGEEIALRWGYGTPEVFALARANGVTLTRSGGGGEETLFAGLRPLPLPLWAALADTSDFAAVLAQGLYGDAEPVSDPELAREQADARFGLTFFAADHDFAAASAAALGFLDEGTRPATRYTYTLSIDRTAYSTTITVLSSPPPLRLPPQQPAAEWNRNGQVTVSWLREATDTTYTSYYVIRGELTRPAMQRINRLPLVQILNEQNYDSLQYFTDTTARIETGYRYRVLGMTPFGRFGPASEEVVLEALRRPLVGPPAIAIMQQVVDTLYRVEWEAAAGDVADLEGYRVAVSPDAFGPYDYVTDLLPPTTTNAALVEPNDGDYVRVDAFDRQGMMVSSLAKILRVFDQTPPAPPTGLSGAIDSTGQVTLNWTANEEDDLSGYRVYVANRPTGYFPQLTAKEIRRTTYADSVTMDTRAEEVYYKVKAIDYTGNYSDFSEVLTLKRPDFRPPTEPVIRSMESDFERVRFSTAFSSSEDVEYHLLERLESGQWATVDTIRATEPVAWVEDRSGAPGRVYSYRVTAVDDVDLRASSPVVEGAKTDNMLREGVQDFSVFPVAEPTSALVRWTYPVGTGLRGFQVYRAAPGEELRAYAFLTPRSPQLRFIDGRFQFTDRSVAGGAYSYQLMAVHQDGGHSPLTDPVTVTLD